MIGQRFHRLLVVEEAEPKYYKGKKHHFYRCKCDCGNVIVSHPSNLRRGATKSCGCWKKETAGAHRASHRMSNSDEYKIWAGIKKRCYNKKQREFHLWGGRGIKMCAEWKNDFVSFYKDMGPRPSKSHSIDRIDNNGNYCKSNCRWATDIEQGSNTRICHIVNFRGEKFTVRQFSLKLSHSYFSVYDWIIRKNMTTDEVAAKVANCQLKHAPRAMYPESQQ